MNDDKKIIWKKSTDSNKQVSTSATQIDPTLGNRTLLDLAARSTDQKTNRNTVKKDSETLNNLQDDIQRMLSEIDGKDGTDSANSNVAPKVKNTTGESAVGSSVAAAAMKAIENKQTSSEPIPVLDKETPVQKIDTIESIKESINNDLKKTEKINKDNVLDDQTKKLIADREGKKGVGHTYYSDLSSAMGSNEPATMSELLKKARFEKKEKEIFSPRSKKNMLYIIGAIFLLGAIGWIISSLISSRSETVKYIKEKRVSALVYSDMDTGINITNIDSAKTKQAIRKVIETKVPENTFHQIYYVAKDQLGNTRRVGVKQIFDATGNLPPTALYESIENDFMHGVYKTNKNHPFIILKALSYDKAFEGMKEWEPTMIDDLGTYLDLPKEAGDRSLLEPGFKDGLIKNKTVRVARFLPRDVDKRGILGLFSSNNNNTESESSDVKLDQSEDIQATDSVLENTVSYLRNTFANILNSSTKQSYAQQALTEYTEIDIDQEIDIDTDVNGPGESTDLEVAKLRCHASETDLYEREKEKALIFVEYYQLMDTCNGIDIEDPDYESIFGICQLTADTALTGTGYTAADAISLNQVEVDHAAAVVYCDNLTLEDLEIGEAEGLAGINLDIAIEQCLQREDILFAEEKRRSTAFIPYHEKIEVCRAIPNDDANSELYNNCLLEAEALLDGTGYTAADAITLEQAEADHVVEINRCRALTLEDLVIGDGDSIYDGGSIYDDGIYIYEKPRDVLWDILHQLYLDGISHMYNEHVYIGDAQPIVQPVQEVLSLLGLMDEVSITGQMDLVTQDAISIFQEVNGIPQTGVIDLITINVINNIITGQGNIFGDDDIASIDNYIDEEATIGIGTYGNVVQEIQILLYTNGYNVSNINGVFDTELCEVLTSYEENNDLPLSDNPGCIISISTIESLNLLIQEGDYLGAGFTVTEEKGIGSCNQFDEYIGIGSVGAQVNLLQEALQSHGDYNGDIDGIFDQEVLDALHAYQEDNNLPLSGGLNSQTVFSLNQDVSQDGQTSTAFTGLMELGMSSGQMSKIQKLLKKQGYYTDSVDGTFSNSTCSSLKKYQKDNNLDISSDAKCSLNSETSSSLEDLYCEVYPSGQIKTMRGFGIFDGLFGPGTANFGANTADADSLNEGDIVLIYTFLDEKTILITRHESVITEIIRRRAFNDIFNKE